MTIEKQLGKRIKFLRLQKNWSQEDLALEAEVNKNYISDLERGTRNPTLRIIDKIAKAFDIDVEVLLRGVKR